MLDVRLSLRTIIVPGVVPGVLFRVFVILSVGWLINEFQIFCCEYDEWDKCDDWEAACVSSCAGCVPH